MSGNGNAAATAVSAEPVTSTLWASGRAVQRLAPGCHPQSSIGRKQPKDESDSRGYPQEPACSHTDGQCGGNIESLVPWPAV
ncbi:hydroxymethylbilane synthase [Homo sapiens]|uniref:Hydroxymethylbilane synthase n=1 Tax=Homo sapiens TaxID=9606 RepID=F5H4Y7_HUMAN|nr:hydroxymethylbilane synthase [Homo sapiens]KAI4074506.1 hydroxymethylbilane synthase [Homo sapiens]